MPLITLDNISINFANKSVLNCVNAVILKNDKIALIGRNGEGKSTLMKILACKITVDDGKVKIKNGIKISYLEQDLVSNHKKTLFVTVAEGLKDIGQLLIQYQHFININSLAKASKLQEKIDSVNGWQYLHKIDAMLERFKLDKNAILATLSGGLKRRVMLAKSLIQEPDVLLLDEPTNHMDISAILNLEKLLKDFNGTLVLISHDRSFMKNIVNKIFDLDRAKLSTFKCNYDDYIKGKNNQLHAEELATARFDKKLTQEEKWIRQGIKARRTRNEGRVRALNTMRELFVNRLKQQGDTKFHSLELKNNNSKIIFEAKEISYKIADTQLIKQFSILILKGEKIGIIGKNGVGKSTLIKLLLAELKPDSGSIKNSKTIELAYFSQDSTITNTNIKVMDFVSGGREYIDIGNKKKHIIGYLRQFLFTGKQALSPIKTLSGGEKNRLILAKILSKPANLLILDEPTNDLDIETLELLEEMLIAYTGTLILISHDRTFLNNIVSSMIVMDTSGVINQYIGGYDDYLVQKQKITKSKQKTKTIPTKKKKLSYKEQTELNQLPITIESLEAKVNTINTQLSEPDFYKQPHAKDTLIRLNSLQTKLTKLYHKWSELEKY